MSTWIKFKWESTKSVYFLAACLLNVPVFLLAICLCQVDCECLEFERGHLFMGNGCKFYGVVLCLL